MKYSGPLAHRGPLPLAANRVHSFHLFGFQSILCTCFVPRNSKRICAANTSGQGLSGNGDPNGFRSSNPLQAGSTRLGQIIGARTRELIVKFNSVRRNFPLKIFLLLLGFYTANALATILGQTGDWDVLVAAILVAVIEGIGFLMYRMPQFLEKFQFIVDLLNYWKAGLSFGLFVDAFKLGS